MIADSVSVLRHLTLEICDIFRVDLNGKWVIARKNKFYRVFFGNDLRRYRHLGSRFLEIFLPCRPLCASTVGNDLAGIHDCLRPCDRFRGECEFARVIGIFFFQTQKRKRVFRQLRVNIRERKRRRIPNFRWLIPLIGKRILILRNQRLVIGKKRKIRHLQKRKRMVKNVLVRRDKGFTADNRKESACKLARRRIFGGGRNLVACDPRVKRNARKRTKIFVFVSSVLITELSCKRVGIERRRRIFSLGKINFGVFPPTRCDRFFPRRLYRGICR